MAAAQDHIATDIRIDDTEVDMLMFRLSSKAKASVELTRKQKIRRAREAKKSHTLGQGSHTRRGVTGA